MLDPFMPFKAAALRAGGLALLAAALTSAIVSRRMRGPRSLAELGPWLWAFAAALGTAGGLSPRLSLVGEIEQREGLLTALALGGLWLGAYRSHKTLAELRRTLDLLFDVAALAAAYAILQMAGLDPLAWVHTATYPSGAGPVLRPFGTLGNPTLLGAALAPALALGAARLAAGRGDPWRLAPIVALLSVASLTTLSRGAWIAASAGALAAAAGGVAMDRGRGSRRAALALGAALVPAALWAALVLRGPFSARVTEGAEAVSAPVRAEIARAALALFRSLPWLGTGPDAFGLAFPRVQPLAFWRTEWFGMPVHAHSVPFQVLATGGALAALAGLAWLAGITIALARAWRNTGLRGDVLAIGAALASLVVAGLLNVVGLAGAAIFVTLAALAARVEAAEAETVLAALAARVETAAAATSPAPPVPRVPRAPVLVALAVVVVVALGAGAEFRALAAAGRARGALDRVPSAPGELRTVLADRAWHDAEVAATRAPGEDELQRLACDAALARAEDALSRRDAATADSAARDAERRARAAAQLEPRRAANHDRLGNALAMRARVEGADAPVGASDSAWTAFALARALAPVDALILADEARAALALGKPAHALERAARITALYPEAATGHLLVASASLAMKQRTETRAALRRALAARWEVEQLEQRRAAEALLRELDRGDRRR